MADRPAGSVVPLAVRWSARWEQAREWMGLGLIYIPVGERLLALYSEPTRHYHDARHVLSCLDAFDNFPGIIRDNDAVELAIWFHDAVYNPRAEPGANELDSANLFSREMGDLVRAIVDVDKVRRLILATRHNEEPEERDAELLLDIDLGTLGSDSVRYDTYAEDIRKEYAHVEDSAYRDGRAAVLRGFLERKWIYHTRHFRKLLEKRARENLARELATLGVSPGKEQG